MRHFFQTATAVAAFSAAFCLGNIGSASADPLISVHTWLAPNAFGSPSYAQAVANANQAFIQDLKGNPTASVGDPNQPTYFHEQSTIPAAEAIVTGFPSWHGQADPGTVFGSQYASELGNRPLFGLVIDGNGTQFSISQLSFTMASAGSPGLDYTFGLGSYSYSSEYEGVLKGADNLFGTADDVFITSGASTQLVDGLIGRGSGNAYDAYCPTSGPCDVGVQQAAIDAAVPSAPFDFTGTYALAGFSSTGSGTFHEVPGAVPEPVTASLLGAGLAGIGFMRRKRKAMTA